MSHQRALRTAPGLVAAVLLVVTGCGPAGPEPDREPHPPESSLSQVDSSTIRLPAPYENARVVDPDWDTTPQYADGVFLAGGERDGMLEFTAVDLQGDVLWAAQRPISCAGFTLSTGADGQALAILTDVQTTTDALADPTATAYDLTTGEHVWGPVDLPGPHQGPGLVFAEPAEAAMGETGPRAALDPATGNLVHTEDRTTGEQIIGEYDGTLLIADQTSLIARDTATTQELWRIPLDKHGWDPGSLGPSVQTPPADGLVLISTSDSTGALIDLNDGTVLNDTVHDAAIDPTTNTMVVLDEAGLHAFDARRQSLWSLTVSPRTTIAAVGGVFLYLRDGDKLRVHNVITGDVAQAYAPDGQGRITVPVDITAEGAALLEDGRGYLLATTGGRAEGRPGS
ncbi:outer membrane protein assembly factor BamB family protein [Promicromonospora xylanilytica]